jgi:alkylhydroperoxidase family enzyme
MARIPYVNNDQLSSANQDLMTGNYNAFRALAHSPDRCRCFRDMVYALKRSKLDPRLRELVMLQVGWLSQCEYEWFHHVRTGLENGVSEDDIRVVAEGTEASYARMDELSRHVLVATQQMFAGPSASAEIVAALELALGKECLIDLIVAIGFYIAAVRILSSLGVDLESEYHEYTLRFPMNKARSS